MISLVFRRNNVFIKSFRFLLTFKSGHFWTTYTPLLVNVVCERPLIDIKFPVLIFLSGASIKGGGGRGEIAPHILTDNCHICIRKFFIFRYALENCPGDTIDKITTSEHDGGYSLNYEARQNASKLNQAVKTINAFEKRTESCQYHRAKGQILLSFVHLTRKIGIIFANNQSQSTL